MKPCRLIFAATLSLVVIAVLVFPYPTVAQRASLPGGPALSPYWHPAVSRWEHIVLQYAQERSLDPDLIAAVIWKESLGQPRERGPAGAVGLMGLMPFDWRPSVEELENPWTNIHWGARALAHTIRDGEGDLFYSLAAYNGGWDKIDRGATRRYAADVLGHYARAVAVRYGLPTDGDWIAVFATEGAPSPSTITVLGPQRPLARYTERLWIQADIPAAPAGTPPHTIVITFVDKYGVERRVGMWLVTEDGSPLARPAAQIISASLPVGYGRREQHTMAGLVASSMAIPTPAPTPTSTPATSPSVTPTQPPSPMDTPTPMPAVAAVTIASDVDLRPGADTWWDPHQTLPAGTDLMLSGYDPNFPEWVYVHTVDGASTGWVQIADLGINRELSDLPSVTPIPTLTPTPHTPPLTPTLSAQCAGGPLRLDAWDLSKVRASDSWTATIYAEGYGGDCIYTYAWQGEVKGGPMSGPMTFEVSMPDRLANIVGTVSVTSAGETVEVGLFIKPQD